MKKFVALFALVALVAGASVAEASNSKNCKQQAPGPVQDLRATATSPTSIQVSFKEPPGNVCVDSYLVDLVPISSSKTVGSPIQQKSTGYNVVYTNLPPNTEFRATVYAVSPNGKSSGASVQTKTPADPNACPQSLGPVVSLTSSAASSSSGLSLRSDWSIPSGVSSNCIAGYKWQLVDPKTGAVLREESPYNPSMSINSGLDYSRPYQVRVYAYPKTSSGGKGPQGAPSSVSVTTPAAPCPSTLPAVGNLVSKSELQAASSLAVRSSWAAPSGVTSSCVKEYVWTLTESTTGNQIAKAKTNGLQMYWSSSIKPDTKYKSRVAAIDAKGTTGAAATYEFVSGPYAVTAGRR